MHLLKGIFVDYAFLETFTRLLAHILYAFRAEMPRDMHLDLGRVRAEGE